MKPVLLTALFFVSHDEAPPAPPDDPSDPPPAPPPAPGGQPPPAPATGPAPGPSTPELDTDTFYIYYCDPGNEVHRGDPTHHSHIWQLEEFLGLNMQSRGWNADAEPVLPVCWDNIVFDTGQGEAQVNQQIEEYWFGVYSVVVKNFPTNPQCTSQNNQFVSEQEALRTSVLTQRETLAGQGIIR